MYQITNACFVEFSQTYGLIIANFQTICYNIIKEKYYPELNVAINKDGDGVTLYHSIPQILSKDSRYVLVTASM